MIVAMKSRRTKFIAIVSSALALAAVMSLGSGGAPAHAQSGYRMCGVYNSANQANGIGTGLVVKVWKDDNSNTCGKKIDFMTRYYGSAYRNSTAQHSFWMISCEDFFNRIAIYQDDCGSMDVNKIYRMYSAADLLHPTSYPYIQYWHD